MEGLYNFIHIMISRIKFISPTLIRPFANSITGTFATLKQSMKAVRNTRAAPKMEILSLTSQQLYQLSGINHYTISVDYLQKNQLSESKKRLNFALNQATNRYPKSVNLHMCILNRIAILEKLLAEEDAFTQTLQKIFFMCYSLKGDKSLDTMKHLENYLIALLLYDPHRAMSVIEFLKDENSKVLLKKISPLVGIAEFEAGERSSGIESLEQSTATGFIEKARKMNNLGWLKLLSATNEVLEYSPKNDTALLNESLQHLVSALAEAQKGGDLDVNEKQLEQNLQMVASLQEFLSSETATKTMLKVSPSSVLLNSHSHVIAMNIAYCLFFLKRHEESIIFMKIGLENAIKIQEPDRLGLGLVLFAKLNQQLVAPWEPIILNILSKRHHYSPAVLKETLTTYSRFLFMERRFLEAEDYMNQSMQVKANLCAEGLYLPEYDFSY